MKNLSFTEFANTYCERMENTPEELHKVLSEQQRMYNPTGWMLLECQQLDSSRCGHYVILPYGPQNTYKEIPNHLISPRGLSSDMSTVAAICTSLEK